MLFLIEVRHLHLLFRFQVSFSSTFNLCSFHTYWEVLLCRSTNSKVTESLSFGLALTEQPFQEQRNPVPFCLNCCINYPLTDPLSFILKIKKFSLHYCGLKSLLFIDCLLISTLNVFPAVCHHVLTCASLHV